MPFLGAETGLTVHTINLFCPVVVVVSTHTQQCRCSPPVRWSVMSSHGLAHLSFVTRPHTPTSFTYIVFLQLFAIDFSVILIIRLWISVIVQLFFIVKCNLLPWKVIFMNVLLPLRKPRPDRLSLTATAQLYSVHNWMHMLKIRFFFFFLPKRTLY